jgi:inositol 1,4,5-triphosphate receptor type 1
MASAGNNKLHDSHNEIKENYPYEMKMKHQRIIPGRASNGNVAVGERLDFYNDPRNKSRLDDSTTTTLSSVNSTLQLNVTFVSMQSRQFPKP